MRAFPDFPWIDTELNIRLACVQAFPREVRLESWDKSKKMNDGGGGGERNSIGNAYYAG